MFKEKKKPLEDSPWETGIRRKAVILPAEEFDWKQSKKDELINALIVQLEVQEKLVADLRDWFTTDTEEELSHWIKRGKKILKIK